MSSSVEYVMRNGQTLLPSYVSAIPSMKTAAIISVLVLVLGMYISRRIHKKNRDGDLLERHVYLLVGVLTLFVTLKLYMILQKKLYVVNNLQANSQHFANVFWLKEYMEAFNLVDGVVF